MRSVRNLRGSPARSRPTQLPCARRSARRSNCPSTRTAPSKPHAHPPRHAPNPATRSTSGKPLLHIPPQPASPHPKNLPGRDPQPLARAYGRAASDREDIAQEIALQLWRSLDRYDPRFRETTWIYRIALNVAISFHRRERRHRERRLAEDAPLIAIAAPEAIEPSADVELFLGCVEALGALDKALVLLYLDGNDHASIAEVLGISVSNVGTKLHRIKERLRAAFESRARSREKETHATR